MPVKQTDPSGQIDSAFLEQVGGTQSFQFGGQTTNVRQGAWTLGAAMGSISTQVSSTGFTTATTGAETTIVSFSLPAKTLDVVGRGILITVWGTSTFASGTSVVKVYFGSVGTTVGTLATTNAFYAELYAFKTGSSTQTGVFNTTANTTSAAPLVLTQTESDTAAILIKVTGNTSAVASAVAINGFIVTAFN